MSQFLEGRRKLVHMGMLGVALLLRPLSWWQVLLLALVAVLYNAFVFRRLHGSGMFKESERGRAFDRGMVYYPLSLLILLSIFRDELIVVGAAWAILALGDSTASVLGKTIGGPRLPWNRDKSWVGTNAFVVAGGFGAAAFGFYLRERTFDGVPPSAALIVLAAFAAAAVTALFESLELGVDDNLVVPLCAAASYWLFLRADWGLVATEPFWWTLVLGLFVAVLTGSAAYRVNSVDELGVLGGVSVGTAVWLGGGLAGFITLVSFFVAGVAATRVGYREKAASGLAEIRGGRRTWIHALANGFTGACACVAAALVPELAPVFLLAFVASFATAGADTVSSEIGKRYGKTCYLPTTFRKVEPGTEGAMSVEGTSAGVAAAVVISAVAWIGGVIGFTGLIAAVLGAIWGNYLESLAGHVVGAEGEVENEILNFLNTLAGAIVAVILGSALGAV